MLVKRAQMWMLLLLGMLLAACGGGGGSPGETGVVPQPPATTGALAVTVSGLPAGVNAALRVTGPNNFTQDLTQTQTLSNLAPGSYNLTAAAVTSGGTTYTPTPATQGAVVSAGATASAAVSYGGASSTLSLGVTRVAELESPTHLAAPPGDARLFVTERPGRVRIIQNGNVLSAPFLDISARVATAGEGGLLSLAFDPQFARNGYVYLYYTDAQRDIVVERFTASANPNLADATSGLVIIRVPHPGFTNHFGGQLAFGPDGYLYLAPGDGGGAGDPQRNGQNFTSLLGKLLRLDVANASAAQPYAIPPDNPYIAMSSRRGEIWAAGLRNPWRFSFDGGQLYLPDVGQDQREEVNIVGASQGGLNFGWNIMEGTLCFNASSCDRSGLTLPAFEYEHGSNNANGCSITGGHVYRGRALPELAGHYFYSDFCGGWLKSFVAGAGGITQQRDWNLQGVRQVVSFGRDAEGELYLLSAAGGIYKIGRASTP